MYRFCGCERTPSSTWYIGWYKRHLTRARSLLELRNLYRACVRKALFNLSDLAVVFSFALVYLEDNEAGGAEKESANSRADADDRR